MKLKQRIINWLDIPKPKEPKDWTDDFAKLEKEMWKHRHLLQKRAITKCPVCNKNLKLWPLEDEAYYTRDGKAYHVKCYAIEDGDNNV